MKQNDRGFSDDEILVSV